MSEEIRVAFAAGPDDDPAELDRLAMALREEILLLDDVDDVTKASDGPAPDGTKAIEVAVIGALIVKAANNIEAVGKIVNVVKGWFARRQTPTSPLTITVGDKTMTFNATDKEREQMVAQFLAELKQDDAQPSVPQQARAPEDRQDA